MKMSKRTVPSRTFIEPNSPGCSSFRCHELLHEADVCQQVHGHFHALQDQQLTEKALDNAKQLWPTVLTEERTQERMGETESETDEC